eukprot:COSAG04_NODE_2432_length_4134_cov_3.602726_2_plen_76_part_00
MKPSPLYLFRVTVLSTKITAACGNQSKGNGQLRRPWKPMTEIQLQSAAAGSVSMGLSLRLLQMEGCWPGARSLAV